MHGQQNINIYEIRLLKDDTIDFWASYRIQMSRVRIPTSKIYLKKLIWATD